MAYTTFDFDLLPQPWRRRLPSISTSILRYGIEGLRCLRQRDSMLAAKGFDARVVKPLKSLARLIFDGMQFGIITRRTLGGDGESKDINKSHSSVTAKEMRRSGLERWRRQQRFIMGLMRPWRLVSFQDPLVRMVVIQQSKLLPCRLALLLLPMSERKHTRCIVSDRNAVDSMLALDMQSETLAAKD